MTKPILNFGDMCQVRLLGLTAFWGIVYYLRAVQGFWATDFRQWFGFHVTFRGQLAWRHLLEEHVQAADASTKVLWVACERIDVLNAKLDLLTTGIEQARTDHNALANYICDLGVDAMVQDWELGVVFWAGLSFKIRVAARDTRASTAEFSGSKDPG